MKKSVFKSLLKLSFLLLLLIVCNNTQASTKFSEDIQEIYQEGSLQIRGKVTDATGQPLPGANVMIEGTSKGVVTDIDGYYVIDAERGNVLIFSYIGFEDQTVQVAKRLAIDVTLREATTLLEEAIVVGMGSQRKASVIGSISTIKTEALDIPQRSLVSALSGRIAGATIVQRSGEPGYDNAQFWVRGIATLGANKSPLILVETCLTLQLMKWSLSQF